MPDRSACGQDATCNDTSRVTTGRTTAMRGAPLRPLFRPELVDEAFPFGSGSFLGGAQGACPGDRRNLAGPQAVLARGPVVRAGSPREHRPGVCRRGTADALPGDGVHPGRVPPAATRPHRPSGRAGDRVVRTPDRRGVGRRPRPGPHPPGHQAGQRPDRRRPAGAGQDHRLRPGAGGRRRQPDPERRARRHADVHGSGASQGRRSTTGPTCSASAA